VSGPDPTKVYIATDSFVMAIDGHEVTIGKGSPRMGDDPVVLKGFPTLWIEADLDPETRARRRMAETSQAPAPAAKEIPLRRPTGRPGWTEERFFVVYRAARERCAPGAPDKELAAATQPIMSAEWFGRLVERFGRPE
jgi:hypothetical protein